MSNLETSARSLGVELKAFEVRGLEDLDGVFKEAVQWRANGVNLLASPQLHVLSRTIIDLAARHRLPTIYQWSEAAAAGGLMAYGPSLPDMFRTLFELLGRILKGAKSADLPVEQPTKFELVINVKTARALGVTMPQSLLLRADRVIE